MAILERKQKSGPIKIDLTAPEGNAFRLLGLARSLARQLDYSKKEIEDLMTEMTGSDYDYLIKTFDDHFGNYVNLYK
jgi:hypothetical protein|tara:strand:- start:44 stop:274 length:231 start_codon:yes stop_codon:yes gene_type:complete